MFASKKFNLFSSVSLESLNFESWSVSPISIIYLGWPCCQATTITTWSIFIQFLEVLWRFIESGISVLQNQRGFLIRTSSSLK
jgi:hypothetical protein